MSEEDRWSAPPLHVTDPAMLRAFAHPVRQRILQELAVRNHARAADLARWLGEPANALSFHLRTLAKSGLIHELPEKARDRRDRVWELASQGGYQFEDPAADPNISPFIAGRVDWLRRLVARELDTDETVSAVQFAGALLTKAEAKQFADELAQLVTTWRKRGAAGAAADPDDPQRVLYSTVFAVGPAGPAGPAERDRGTDVPGDPAH
jgi:DNA-binding transcriptional ArsR family regulator